MLRQTQFYLMHGGPPVLTMDDLPAPSESTGLRRSKGFTALLIDQPSRPIRNGRPSIQPKHGHRNVLSPIILNSSMSSWLRRTIRGLVAPGYRISCSQVLWETGTDELRHRGGDFRESGAFLLGRSKGNRRRIEQFVYYDDLDPHALDSGIIDLDGSAYGMLWSLCRESGLTVVADVHTHPRKAFLSGMDRKNPMIAASGHLAIVLPNYAADRFSRGAMEMWGLYEYSGCHAGRHHWSDLGERNIRRHLYIGQW